MYYHCTATEGSYNQIKASGLVLPKRLPNVYCFKDPTDADNYIKKYGYYDKFFLCIPPWEIASSWQPKYAPGGVIKLKRGLSATILPTDISYLKMAEPDRGSQLLPLLLWLYCTGDISVPNNEHLISLQLLGLLDSKQITELGKEFLHKYLLRALERMETGNIVYRTNNLMKKIEDEEEFQFICNKSMKLITAISELVPYLTHINIFIKEAAKIRYKELKLAI